MKRLTKKEKGVADGYLETGNGTQAALDNYDTENKNSAAVLASRTLRKVKVQEYLEKHAPKAASKIVSLSNQTENLPVALGATKDILDRTGFKPVEKNESKSIRVNLEVKIENKELELLREEYEAKLKSKLLK